jgi:regulator of protease activity HflC (stomatin/prohibitin superfamily)
MFKLIVTIPVMITFSVVFWGSPGLAATAALTALFLFVWVVKRGLYVRVPEMEVAVVYRVESKAFSRFLDTGRHWLIPFIECVESTISTAPETVQDRTESVQTVGGLSLAIEWSLAYTLNPFKVPADNQAKMARTLPRKAATVAKKHMSNCLQHVVDEYTLEQLCQPGAHKPLERQVRQLVAERLASLGFEVSRVMIGAIELPAHVRATLEAAHERQMQVENEAHALAHLQKVISHFSDADVQRLMELERIHLLGQNGVTLLYPTFFERDMANRAMNSYTKLAASKAVVTPGVS